MPKQKQTVNTKQTVNLNTYIIFIIRACMDGRNCAFRFVTVGVLSVCLCRSKIKKNVSAIKTDIDLEIMYYVHRLPRRHCSFFCSGNKRDDINKKKFVEITVYNDSKEIHWR